MIGKDRPNEVWLDLNALRKHLRQHPKAPFAAPPFVDPSPISSARYEEDWDQEEAEPTKTRFPLRLIQKQETIETNAKTTAAELQRKAKMLRAAAQELCREARQLEINHRPKQKSGRSRSARALAVQTAKKAV